LKDLLSAIKRGPGSRHVLRKARKSPIAARL
jgi:hypothetical protein